MLWSLCTNNLEISFENLMFSPAFTDIFPEKYRHLHCLGSRRWDFKLIFDGTVVGLAAKITLKITLLLALWFRGLKNDLLNRSYFSSNFWFSPL